MATLRDVAQNAGVSVVTASSVLNGMGRVRVSAETARRIQETARVLNYIPRASALRLRTGRAQAISFLPSARARWQSDWQELLRGVSSVLWDRKEHLIFSMPRDEKDELEILRHLAFGKQVDGFLLQGGSVSDPRLPLVREAGLPFVLIGGPNLPRTHVVRFDERALGRELASRARPPGGSLVILAARPKTAEEAHFLAGCAEGGGPGPLREWTGAWLPEPAWLREAAREGGGTLGILLTRQLLPELSDCLARADLPQDTVVRILYLAGPGEVPVLPPPGITVVAPDFCTLGRRAAQQLCAVIDQKDAGPRASCVEILGI